MKLRHSLLVIWLSALAASHTVYADENPLNELQIKIQREFDAVEHVSTDALSKNLSDDVVLFDVREQDEFAVSHLANAILVSPEIDSEEFVQRFSQQIEGKRVYFYCSVGYRSSALIDRLSAELKDAGVMEAKNVEGGIFKWHNEEKPLVQGSTNTSYVHPYNFFWGRYINRSKLKRYKPN